MNKTETIDRTDVEEALGKLVEALQLRADTCTNVAATSDGGKDVKARLYGKAAGYQHAAEMADALGKWLGPTERF